MSPPRHGGLFIPPGFAARKASRVLPAAEARRIWADLVAEARLVATLAQATPDDPATGQRIRDLQHQAARMTAPGFPVTEAAAMLTADAFLLQLRALAIAAMPERRLIYAGALAALAGALDGLIHAERQRLADGWRGQHGGDR